MADRPPPLRLVPGDEDGADGGGDRPATDPPVKRKLPKHLYLPAPTMKTIWCRFSIGGVLHRQSTGCRDVRNAERRATAIRAELEAEAQGIAAPKRILLKDAVSDFGRHIATGRGGKDRQEKNIRLLRTVLGPKAAPTPNCAGCNGMLHVPVESSTELVGVSCRAAGLIAVVPGRRRGSRCTARAGIARLQGVDTLWPKKGWRALSGHDEEATQTLRRQQEEQRWRTGTRRNSRCRSKKCVWRSPWRSRWLGSPAILRSPRTKTSTRSRPGSGHRS